MYLRFPSSLCLPGINVSSRLNASMHVLTRLNGCTVFQHHALSYIFVNLTSHYGAPRLSPLHEYEHQIISTLLLIGHALPPLYKTMGASKNNNTGFGLLPSALYMFLPLKRPYFPLLELEILNAMSHGMRLLGKSGPAGRLTAKKQRTAGRR